MWPSCHCRSPTWHPTTHGTSFKLCAVHLCTSKSSLICHTWISSSVTLCSTQTKHKNNLIKSESGLQNTDVDMSRVDMSFSNYNIVSICLKVHVYGIWIIWSVNKTANVAHSRTVILAKCWQMVRISAPLMDCWCFLICKAFFFPATMTRHRMRSPLKTCWVVI